MADEILTNEIDDCAGCLESVDAWSRGANRSKNSIERAEQGINRFLHKHGLGGLADVVQHLRVKKSVRLYDLERALDVNKVVISGSMSLSKMKLKDILSGRTKDVKFESATIQIKITF